MIQKIQKSLINQFVLSRKLDDKYWDTLMNQRNNYASIQINQIHKNYISPLP